MNPAKILLIRHGETDGNATRTVQVPATPLSVRGRSQARLLAERLRDVGVGHILTSDLRRAEETAEFLAEATGRALELDPLLQERNFGDLRGRRYEEPGVGENIMAPGYAPPGGESWEVFHARVGQAWERVESLALDLAAPLAVVTHGLVVRAVLTRHVSRDAQVSVDTLGNTCLSIIEGPEPWRATTIACTAHLDEQTAHDKTTIAGI